MNFLLDLLYLCLLLCATPWLAFQAVAKGKYRTGWGEKLLGLAPIRHGNQPCIWIHAVSVGEVLLLRRVIARLRARAPRARIVVSTTTNTGMEVARQHLGDHTLFYFPLDFSWSVRRAIRRVRPDMIVLAELELWPNFIAAAHRRHIPVALINGRMSPRSYRGYRRIRPVMAKLLGNMDCLAVQTPEYARRFVELGGGPAAVTVTGSVKYDGLETDRENPATRRLRELLAMRPDEIVWVAGSTSAPEERIALQAYARLRARYPRLRLVIVPRHQERFDEVARLIRASGFGMVRRSRQPGGTGDAGAERSENAPGAGAPKGVPGPLETTAALPVVLVDTLGELVAVWGLADIAFVGGSFAPRGGQNMIDPAAFGAAVVLGPGTWNFADTVSQLHAHNALIQIDAPDALAPAVAELVADPETRKKFGDAARSFVLNQHGATERTVELLLSHLPGAAAAGDANPAGRPAA